MQNNPLLTQYQNMNKNMAKFW